MLKPAASAVIADPVLFNSMILSSTNKVSVFSCVLEPDTVSAPLIRKSPVIIPPAIFSLYKDS